MSQQVFIAVTDDMLFNHPEQIEGPLVPYYTGMDCHHWLSIEINPEETSATELKATKKSSGKLFNRVMSKAKQRKHVKPMLPKLHVAYSR